MASAITARYTEDEVERLAELEVEATEAQLGGAAGFSNSRTVRMTARDDSDSSDGANSGGDNGSTFKARCRKGVILTVGLGALVGLALWVGPNSGQTGRSVSNPQREKAISPPVPPPLAHAAPRPPLGAKALTAEPRSLLAAPELEDIIVHEVHTMSGGDATSKEHLRDSVRRLLGQFSDLVDEQVSAADRRVLREANLGWTQWQDFGKMLRGLRDGRLQKLGHRILEIVRESKEAPPAVVEKQLKDELMMKRAELQKLHAELVPASVREALKSWGAKRKRTFGANASIQLWNGMLSPQALEEIRKPAPAGGQQAMPQSQVGSQNFELTSLGPHVRALATRAGGSAVVSSPALRRLADTWYTPTLNTLELSISITSVVLTFVTELLIHLDILVKEFDMPTWAWLLVFCPTEGTALATCMFGLTIWCDIILGAVGINVLDIYFADL